MAEYSELIAQIHVKDYLILKAAIQELEDVNDFQSELEYLLKRISERRKNAWNSIQAAINEENLTPFKLALGQDGTDHNCAISVIENKLIVVKSSQEEINANK